MRNLALTLTALLFQTLSGTAFTLLIIDISDPSAVTFTATTNVSEATSSLQIAYDGLTLEDFFESAVIIPNTTALSNDDYTPGLRPSQSPNASGGLPNLYSGIQTADLDANGALGLGNDLALYSNGSSGLPNTQIFISGQRAFSGESAFNMSSFALPTAGTTGNILSGYLSPATTGHGLIIGQYIVVPEPSTSIIGAIVCSGFLIRRRRY